MTDSENDGDDDGGCIAVSLLPGAVLVSVLVSASAGIAGIVIEGDMAVAVAVAVVVAREGPHTENWESTQHTTTTTTTTTIDNHHHTTITTICHNHNHASRGAKGNDEA